MKDRQFNDQKKKDNMTNNDLQNTTQKIKDPATRTRGGLGCSEKETSSYLTRDTRWVALFCKSDDYSWISEGPDKDYDKQTFVVICEKDIM